MSHVPLKTFLTDLATRGIRLSVHDGRLRCDAPRDTLTPELRDALSARKPEILAFLEGSPDIVRAPDGPVRLSVAQQRLWVVSQLDEDSTAYNMRTALRITGALDLARLEGALDAVVQRHAVLRTAFTVRGTEPVQTIHEDVGLTLEVSDLRERADRQATLDRILSDAARRPFDLARPPLVRATVVRMTDHESVLVVILHHLVADGASLGILVAEVGELYAAAVEGRAPRLPALPVRYADYAVWQRERLDPERLALLRTWWVDHLAGAPPSLDLPTDHPPVASARRRGAVERFVIPPARTSALRALGRTHGTTLFTILLSAFAVVLARYANQTDVVVGSPVSMRDHPDVEPLIGMFVGTMVLRVGLDGNPTLEELLGRVRRTTIEARAHADLPLDQLVEALNPERSPLRHPVFQVMFLHDDAPSAIADVAGLRFETLESPAFDAKFDLMLAMSETPDGIRGVWEYGLDRFEPATIRRATDHLLAVLDALVLAPRQRVFDVPLVTGAERHRMLHDWNRTARAWPCERPFHRLFEAAAERTPDAVAVRLGEDRLTYAALDRRATGVARTLADLGIGRGDRVAVLLPRSFDLLAGLLGILKTGAAYVPLDPTYPAERLGFVLADAAPAALVTTGALADRLDGLPGVVLRLDRDWLPDAAVAPDVRSEPTDPACLMYTSGSTGRPKGAIVTHGGLGNYLRWCADAYRVADGAGAVVSTSIAFDATLTSLFSPLLVGRAVILVPELDELAALAALMSSGEVLGPLKLTPAHVDALRALTDGEVRPGAVHTVVIGGEQLLGEHVAWVRTMAPHARIWNEYGPTETVVGCCVYEVPSGDLPDVVPIGRPIANTRLYVLDERLEPVPPGVPGELYIAGAGVARGYHDRPELTDERFVADPYAAHPAARMYRSGDLVRWMPDGELRFVGRRDGQIKLRGFRIELGEIEAVLAQHPGVRQAAVVVRPGSNDRPRLAAFVVPEAAEAPGEAELRAHLARRLPEHMIPAVLTVLPSFPTTPNGKVDRAALVVADVRDADADEAPLSPLQAELAALWCGVLGHARVGPDDNFFALGGDSILGIQLVARAREQGLRFAPRDLMEHQTIAALARVVRREAQICSDAGPVTGPVRTTPIRRWFFDQAMPEPHHYDQSVMVEVPADIDPERLERALQAVFDHHDALRTRFSTTGDAVIAAPYPVALEVVDLPTDGDLRRTLEAAADARQGTLDLERRVFAPSLLRCGGSARLLLTAHHLVVDGVSWRILLEDLLRAYRQVASDLAIALPPKTSSVRAWGEQLHAWAGSTELAAEEAFWSRVPELPEKELPLDHPFRSEANRVADARVVTRTLSVEETGPLRAVASVYNADLQDLLLAALARTFTDPGDAAVLGVDLESHGRTDRFAGLDLSRTVGWFTSLYPIRLALYGEAEPRHTLMAVKEQRRSVPTLGIGHGVLRTRARTAGRPAQIRFNYFGQLDRAVPSEPGWGLAAESCGAQRSPLQLRSYLIELDVATVGEALAVTWTASARLVLPATLEALASRFIDELRGLVRHCQQTEDPQYTPSDFPDVALSQAELERVLGFVAHARTEGP